MSSWDKLECPWCGLQYGDIKTGLSYMDVYDMMHIPSDDPKRWRFRHRNGVLGQWHAIKLQLWAEHLIACEAQHGGK